MSRRSTSSSGLYVTLAVLALLAGCAGGDPGEQASTDAEPSGSEEVAVLEISPEAAEVLARADLADGTEDHVVAKCPGCNLAMDGSADAAVQMGEYEVHFCSTACSRRFTENTEDSILGLPQP